MVFEGWKKKKKHETALSSYNGFNIGKLALIKPPLANLFLKTFLEVTFIYIKSKKF